MEDIESPTGVGGSVATEPGMMSGSLKNPGSGGGGC